MSKAVHVNRIVREKTWYEVYAVYQTDGRGGEKCFDKRSDAYNHAVWMCENGFNDPPRVEVRLDKVQRQSRVIDHPDFL